MSKRRWSDLEKWIDFGIEKKFDTCNYTSILHSEEYKKRSWAVKGYREGWIKIFPFSNGLRNSCSNYDEWKDHGIKNGYDGKTRQSIINSKDEKLKKWYNRGQNKFLDDDKNKRWTSRFPFMKSESQKLSSNYQLWEDNGIKNGYDMKSPTRLYRSKNKSEKKWINIGKNKKWVKKFPFKSRKSGPVSQFQHFEEWMSFGLKNGFDKMIPSLVYNSKIKDERSWYNRGATKRWVKKFPFIRQDRDQNKVEDLLRNNPEAQTIASLASITDSTSDIAEILVQLYPQRFPSASDLAKSLPGAVKHIGHSLHPFSMEKARDLYEKTKSLPSKTKYALDELLYSITLDQYQKPFNDDTQGTLQELKKFAGQRNGVSKLAKKVLDYYKSVSDFHIPGFGKIKRGRT